MEIKRFMGWLNENAPQPTEPPLVKTGVAKDFAGIGYMADSAMGADEFLRTRSVMWKGAGDTTPIRKPIVKKEGNSYYLLTNSMTMRYMQPDGKNVMEINYVKGDQLVPVANPQLAKKGGSLKPATTQELEKYAKVGISNAKTTTTTTTTTDASGKKLSSTAAKFNFNFDSGRYSIEDITPEKSAQLMLDLKPILSELAMPKLMNGKLEIVITASTSTLGVSANLKAQLAADGFKSVNPKFSGNDALCNARLATIEKFIIDKFTTALKTTPEGFKEKVTITKNPLPNSGSGTTDEERKAFQYIAAEIKQVGESIPATQRLNCNATFSGSGGKAPASANYVGFKTDLYVMSSVGDKVTLTFDPQYVPDMVYFKYGQTEFLSPWLGEKENQSRNYVRELNNFADLGDKINAELRACGSSKTWKDLQPNAKGIQKYPAPAPGEEGERWMVANGPRQNGAKEQFSFNISKDFALDKLIVRVFSPLSDTVFSIKTTCGKADAPAPKK